MKNIKKIGLLLVLGVVAIGYVASTGALTRKDYGGLKTQFDALIEKDTLDPKAAQTIITKVKKDKEYRQLASAMERELQVKQTKQLNDAITELQEKLAGAAKSCPSEALSIASMEVIELQDQIGSLQKTNLGLASEVSNLERELSLASTSTKDAEALSIATMEVIELQEQIGGLRNNHKNVLLEKDELELKVLELMSRLTEKSGDSELLSKCTQDLVAKTNAEFELTFERDEIKKKLEKRNEQIGELINISNTDPNTAIGKVVDRLGLGEVGAID